LQKRLRNEHFSENQSTLLLAVKPRPRMNNAVIAKSSFACGCAIAS